MYNCTPDITNTTVRQVLEISEITSSGILKTLGAYMHARRGMEYEELNTVPRVINRHCSSSTVNKLPRSSP